MNPRINLKVFIAAFLLHYKKTNSDRGAQPCSPDEVKAEYANDPLFRRFVDLIEIGINDEFIKPARAELKNACIDALRHCQLLGTGQQTEHSNAEMIEILANALSKGE